MKKITIFAIVIAIMVSLCSCGNVSQQSSQPNENAAVGTSLPQVMSSDEYLLYQNIFFNDGGSSVEGQQRTFKGVFAELHDFYSNVTRYYVWGYYDQTKCCDWQWEIVPESLDDLPSPGSLVEATGTLRADTAALDGYWYTDATIDVLEEYEGTGADFDLTVLDSTLERVQRFYIDSAPENFEGKTISMYGRIKSPESIQHPYYDGDWEQKIEAKDTVPAIGTMVIVEGVCSNSIITDCMVKETDGY